MTGDALEAAAVGFEFDLCLTGRTNQNFQEVRADALSINVGRPICEPGCAAPHEVLPSRLHSDVVGQGSNRTRPKSMSSAGGIS